MSKTNDFPHAGSAAAHAADAPRNGSLSDRVRSLRLSDRAAKGGGGTRGQIIPWALAAICFVAALGFGYRAYRLTPEETTTPETEKLRQLLAATGGNAANPEDLEKIKKILAANGNGAASREVATSGEVVHESTGYVTPLHQIQVSPQVGGEIIWLDPAFKEGVVYKKGTRLAEVDPVIFAAQLRNAQAALEIAKVNYQQMETGSSLREIDAAKAQLKNLEAKRDLSRIDERYNASAPKGVSRQDIEKASAQVAVDQAACDAQEEAIRKLETARQEQMLVWKNQILSAQAIVDQAAKQLRNCTITAPTTGMVLNKKAELGGYVNPLAFGNVSGSLCEMADLTKIELDVAIQERDFAKIIVPKDGEYQVCGVLPNAFKFDKSFLKTHPNGYLGYVARVMPIADRNKGAIVVRVRVHVPDDEAGVYLKPDMAAGVTFKTKTTREIEPD